MIEKPKKERRFLKTLGKIGEILIQEVLIKIGSNLIKKIGGKKTLPSILFLLASLSLFAQYPNTGNKQRLGFQTTADGLTWRGSISDTASIQPINNQNAWVILDTINLKIYSFDFTSNAWNALSQDTTSLSNRIDLKLNLSDTASMLAPYFKDSDTTSLNLTSRFAAKLNISDTASMLTNYLRSGVAASTYLPLAGGTLTGALSGTSALFSGNVAIGFPFAYKPLEVISNANDFVSVGVRILGQFQWSGIHFGYREADLNYRKSAIVFQRNEAGPADASGKVHLLNVNSFEGSRNADLRDAKLTISNNGFVGINDTSPTFNLDVNGTLGVTGATTLSAPLTVNSSAVFNEGSTDSDFRVESDANINMVFVDASTDRVGIGTNTPTKELDVNGELRIGTVSTTPSALLGKNGSNVVGEVTTVAQTGLMKAGGTTTNTSSVGIITVAHGLSYTPTQVLVTLAQQNSYVIVCHGINSNNLLFTVYDSVTGNALNNVSVGFFWLAIK